MEQRAAATKVAESETAMDRATKETRRAADAKATMAKANEDLATLRAKA
jgi:hypothetical protein